jgi:hypothetical protein
MMRRLDRARMVTPLGSGPELRGSGRAPIAEATEGKNVIGMERLTWPIGARIATHRPSTAPPEAAQRLQALATDPTGIGSNLHKDPLW